MRLDQSNENPHFKTSHLTWLRSVVHEHAQ